MTDLSQLASSLSEAQRRYLRALEPNEVRGTGITAEIERQFQSRAFRAEIGGQKLASASALRKRGIVAGSPTPCECGAHFVSLTPLGLALRAHLEADK